LSEKELKERGLTITRDEKWSNGLRQSITIAISALPLAEAVKLNDINRGYWLQYKIVSTGYSELLKQMTQLHETLMSEGKTEDAAKLRGAVTLPSVTKDLIMRNLQNQRDTLLLRTDEQYENWKSLIDKKMPAENIVAEDANAQAVIDKMLQTERMNAGNLALEINSSEIIVPDMKASAEQTKPAFTTSSGKIAEKKTGEWAA